MLFGELAIQLGLVNEELIYKALGIQSGIPFISKIKANTLFNYNLYKRKEIYMSYETEKKFVEQLKTFKCFPAYIDFNEAPNHIILYIAQTSVYKGNYAFEAFKARLEHYFNKYTNSEAEIKKRKYLKEINETTQNKDDIEIPITKVKFCLTLSSIYEKFELLY